MTMVGRRCAHCDASTVFKMSIGRQGVVGEATEVAWEGRVFLGHRTPERIHPRFYPRGLIRGGLA